MMIDRETEVLGENLLQCHFVHHKSHMTWPDANPGRRGGKPATNRWSYGTALCYYNLSYMKEFGSRNSSVNVATGYGLDGWGILVQFPARTRDFYIYRSVKAASVTFPAFCSVLTGDSFTGEKSAGAWNWPSPPTNTDVKNAWGSSSNGA
jgi:hypothetical protein